MAAPALVCVGHLVREMIHFPDGVQGPFLGSPPAYCSVAAARQGTATGLVSEVGPDMPAALLAPLVEAGVDTAGLRVGKRTTCSELIYDAQGHKEIRYPSTAAHITARHVPAAFHGCGMIYVCTMDNDVRPADLAAVVACSKSSAVDLGGYGGVHMSLAHRRATPSLEKLALDVARHFVIVKASDEDARAIFGWDNAEEAARRLLAGGSQVVVITQGAGGVFVATARQSWQIPALPVKAVDTTGGGDTFMAGFLSAFLRSGDPVQAARWGCATAAWVIRKSGGVRLDRMPSYNDARDMLRTFSER